jgi:hypothetical protein
MNVLHSTSTSCEDHGSLEFRERSENGDLELGNGLALVVSIAGSPRDRKPAPALATAFGRI